MHKILYNFLQQPFTRFFLLFLSVLLGEITTAKAQTIDTTLLRKHIAFLASDSLRGRGTSTPDEKRAAEYLADYFRRLGLQAKGDKGSYFQMFPLIKKNDVLPDSNRMAMNVLGFLDNGKPHTIVIGAHFDHLGLGYDGSSLDTEPKGKIHNGADDNASGVAGMLELARLYATNGVKEPYNVVFMGFSGEELGLLGSKHFGENPTLPLETIHCMVNLDMIGRFNETKKELVVGGTGTNPMFEPLVKNIAARSFANEFALALDSSGVGPSDHTSFYLKKIPVLFFFTGVHTDYHKPSDDIERINIQGEAKVLRYIAQILDSLQASPKLAFQQTRVKQQTGHSYKVSLGVMPAYSYAGKGLKIDAVTAGRPAAKAGIQDGDIIITIGTTEITDIQAYMQVLGKLKAGETVPVRVLRDDKPINLSVTL
ncbi:MAG: M20/M25/M40 family metallo-hydrolase [Candidatus Kapaibacterium sp.]|nr:MAG: M20/M25/M40 family metallo-hydrolase [Candidatus Kapabacteria bacterium]